MKSKLKIYEIIEFLENEHLFLYHSVSKEYIICYIDNYLKDNKIKDDYDFNNFTLCTRLLVVNDV